jgi:hypothetical protein
MRNVILLLLLATGAYAQDFSFEYWHKGKLVTETSDTLKGSIMYNLQTNIIQFQNDTRVEVFTARKVLSFEIFDALTKQYRQFFSLPYADSKGQYKAPKFFELIVEGKMTVLCREALEYKTYNSFSYYGSMTRLVVVNHYFTLDDKGDLMEFVGKKNDWLYMFGNYGDEVQRFVKTNRLDFDEKNDLAKIVGYYNSLFEK